MFRELPYSEFVVAVHIVIPLCFMDFFVACFLITLATFLSMVFSIFGLLYHSALLLDLFFLSYSFFLDCVLLSASIFLNSFLVSPLPISFLYLQQLFHLIYLFINYILVGCSCLCYNL